MDRPPASSERVRRQMSLQRTTGTAPERAVRAELHRRGLRYRLHRRLVDGVRRNVDIVFGPTRVAVMIDGCFWHSCPQHATQPKAHAEWWREKLSRNVERDRQTDRLLTADGWLVLRFWEHQNPTKVADTIEEHVRARRGDPG